MKEVVQRLCVYLSSIIYYVDVYIRVMLIKSYCLFGKNSIKDKTLMDKCFLIGQLYIMKYDMFIKRHLLMLSINGVHSTDQMKFKYGKYKSDQFTRLIKEYQQNKYCINDTIEHIKDINDHKTDLLNGYKNKINDLKKKAYANPTVDKNLYVITRLKLIELTSDFNSFLKTDNVELTNELKSCIKDITRYTNNMSSDYVHYLEIW